MIGSMENLRTKQLPSGKKNDFHTTYLDFSDLAKNGNLGMIGVPTVEKSIMKLRLIGHVELQNNGHDFEQHNLEKS